jgi:hypothetical protein
MYRNCEPFKTMSLKTFQAYWKSLVAKRPALQEDAQTRALVEDAWAAGTQVPQNLQNKGWRPMTTAPRDGTMVLITETPNGEHYNVLPAMYMNLGGGDPSLGEKAEGIVDWWGIAGSRRTGEGGDCQLPVRLKALACTPICWMPLPPMEDVYKLRRRLSQLLRYKYSAS